MTDTLDGGLYYIILSSDRLERLCPVPKMINQVITPFHRIQYSSAQTSKSSIKYTNISHFYLT